MCVSANNRTCFDNPSPDMPANYCASCGKKATRTRSIDQQTSNCAECAPPKATSEAGTTIATTITADMPAELQEIDDSEPLSNVSFGDLKTWLTSVNAGLVSEFETKLMQQVVSIKKDLETTKNNLTETNSKVEKLQKDLTDLKKTSERSLSTVEGKTKTLDDEAKQLKAVGQNNLKYLINLDRNIRREHIVVFGVPEDGEDLAVNEVVAKTDQEKCDTIFSFIDVPMNIDNIHQFRLGKPTEGKVRPIKLKCPSSSVVGPILKAAKKLKELPNQTIYIKPDKTKSEVEEYQRLGKRKTELLLQYPVAEGVDPRVVLEKGILKLDGVQVDEFKSSQSLF